MSNEATITLPAEHPLGPLEFESHRDCADRLGVSVSAVTQAKKRGKLATLGTGRADPVRDDEGNLWPSWSALARHWGVTRATAMRRAKGIGND